MPYGTAMQISVPSNQITRSSGTTAYAAGQAMANAADSKSYVINLGSNPNGCVVKGGRLTSSKASALNGVVYLTTTDPGTVTDGGAYNPSAATMRSRLGKLALDGGVTSTAPQVWHELTTNRDIFVPAGITTLYGVHVFSGAYTPDSVQTSTLNLDVLK